MSQNNQLERRADHPFRKIFGNFWDENLPLFEERTFNSPISLSEDDQSVYVEASLAGLSREEIDITLEKKVLWIRGTKKEVQDNKKYHYKSKRSYSYQIALPESIDDSKDPETKYENGVVSIIFAKSKCETPKKIQIK